LELVNPVSAQESQTTPVAEQVPQAEPTQEVKVTIGESLLGQITTMLNLQPEPTATEPVVTVCGGPPEMMLLVVGTDQRSNNYLYGLADSIRLVHLDFVDPALMLVDIPRDLWVEIPGIADHGVTHGKINQAFLFGSPGWGFYDDPGEGPGLLARTLEQNYGVDEIDHYIAMNMATFRNIIDGIGGIDIYLGYYLDFNEGQDGANPDIVFEPGYYHLDGEQALMFARNRNPSTFQRAKFQDLVLDALQAKLLNPGMIPQLPGLALQFKDAVLTDLSPNVISQLVCLSKLLTEENTHFVSFPVDMFTGGSTYDPYRKVNTYTLSVDNALMRSYFAAFMDGTWPQE
jgi:LCP family protein required for cell wall assembly